VQPVLRPNPQLNQIGETTAKYTGVGDKVRFFDCKFEDFISDRTYDLVFSLAAFFTADGRERENAQAYFGRIFDFLNPGGRLFYESTSFLIHNEGKIDPHQTASEETAVAISAQAVIQKDWTEQTGDQGGNRRFILAAKH
jgi:hypothetical protein